MIFLDTNILIAATLVRHPHNRLSQRLLVENQSAKTVIAAHTIAEVYSGLTRLPPPERVAPKVAMAAIEMYLLAMEPVALSSEEYLATVRDAALNGHAGGKVYDALLLACARKSGAERIYTWNLRHFQALAPDLAHRILTP